MSLNEIKHENGPGRDLHQGLEPELAEASGDFRQSLAAWGDAAYSRPRSTMAAVPAHRIWRLAAGWALGCVLIAGSVTTGVLHHQHQMAAARQAEQQRQSEQKRLQEQQRQLAEVARQKAIQVVDDEDLLAKVDRDVSRAVPSAMEPLAQLMTGDETQ